MRAVTVPPVSAPYRPGQPQWPDNRQQRPDRPPPIQFGQEPPPPSPPGKSLVWGMRVLGLVAIAVVSGLVWFYITNDSSSTSSGNTGETTPQQPAGAYEFTPYAKMPKPDRVENCAEHAYGKQVPPFLASTPCDHLTRQLFVTKVDGRTIYTSVSVVTMKNEAKAAALRDLTDKDGTGNISDVVRDKVVTIDGLNGLSGHDGYDAQQSGRDVIVVESDFAPKDKSSDEQADEDILDKVSTDALRLGADLDSGTG
jgi:hypothetical protein